MFGKTFFVIYSNSMEQSPSWESDSHLPSQEISSFYETRIFITVFTTACH
jgi:hypothetical protein